jgi:uncharacterized protein YidB (DUF937 family)
MTINDQYEVGPEEARQIIGGGVTGYTMDRGGVSKMLEEGDMDGIQQLQDILRPHITAHDIENARKLNAAIEQLVEETGLSFDEARILIYEKLETMSKGQGE